MAENTRLQLEPGLMEAVVTRALAQRIAGPASFTEHAFHAEADSIYGLKNEAQRSARFQELFARWFRRGQFDQPFRDALAELPELEKQVDRVTVTTSSSKADERADLAVADGLPAAVPQENTPFANCCSASDQPFGEAKTVDIDNPNAAAIAASKPSLWVGISIQPARFMDRPLLRRWLRHELWHIRDMIDPAFQYRREDLAAGSAERLPQRLIQERYALLWSLSIEARVERSGLLPLQTREERLTRIAGHFRGFTEEAQREILESIGSDRGLSHPELLQLARDPKRLAREVEQGAVQTRPVRGSACPLCHFPTFHWADLTQPRAAPVVEAIRGTYPEWDRSHGTCSTCFDMFSIRGGIWA